MINEKRLDYYLEKPVSELVRLDQMSIAPGLQERHRIYLLLLMALVHHYRNGNKKGRVGLYPWNENNDPEAWKEDPNAKGGKHLGGDYFDHNIGAVAVDGDGRVIDFDFNHNELLNSSVEHAESRLVRRVYSLAQIHDTWNVAPGAKSDRWPAKDGYTTFENVTVYTSLEPCSQCAGIMALGRVWRVVYLQTDPGMYLISNILRNLTKGTKLEAPLPIGADKVGLGYFDELNAAFEDFTRKVATEQPFFIPKDTGKAEDRAGSVTSFLCTKMAQDIYGRGASEFEDLIGGRGRLDYPRCQPPDRDGNEPPGALKNSAVVDEVKGFYYYAIDGGRRGTPHQL